MTTPPPQGNPFAQGQNPYAQGQPPQGQAPYPQQPGQPGFPQQGMPVPPQQPGSKWTFKKIKNIVVGVVVVGVVIGGFIASRDDANTAKVGDCMSIGNPDSVTDPDLEVVDCSDSKAAYKVAEKKDDTSTGCDRNKYAEYTQTGDGDNFTLCLEQLSASK
ncbi:LppU/SCO3897 family protein [Streptomyces chartreusis]